MRHNRVIPKTDLGKLVKEVLSRGPQAALPQNLPDRWLRALARDLAQAQKARLEGRPEDPNVDITAPVLMVATFLAASHRIDDPMASMSPDELTATVDRLGAALRNEIVGRETGVFVREYTLENII